MAQAPLVLVTDPLRWTPSPLCQALAALHRESRLGGLSHPKVRGRGFKLCWVRPLQQTLRAGQLAAAQEAAAAAAEQVDALCRAWLRFS